MNFKEWPIVRMDGVPMICVDAVDYMKEQNAAIQSKLDASQAALSEARAEIARLEMLIKIADELITNENAKEDWEDAKRPRFM